MRYASVCLSCVVLFLTLGSATLAEEGGWRLNPFAKKAGPPTSGSSTWKMPSLWPRSTTTAAQPKPASPSTWQKMQTGTRNFWSKTADVMNPWDDGADTAAPPSPSGRSSPFRQASASRSAQQKQQGSSFWSWGGQDEEPEEKMDVNSFLSQKRPGY